MWKEGSIAYTDCNYEYMYMYVKNGLVTYSVCLGAVLLNRHMAEYKYLRFSYPAMFRVREGSVVLRVYRGEMAWLKDFNH